MRAIKFRVWDGERMHYTSFGRVNGYDGPTIKTDRPLDCTWMQYTGLKDANGTEIYEGDLIHVVMPASFIGSETSDLVRPVKYGYGGFYVDGIDELSTFNHHRDRLEVFEVIGNRFEHPHLLEKEVVS